MKMKKISPFKIISIITITVVAFACILVSCNNENNGKQSQKKDTITVFVDEVIAPMIAEPLKMFRENKTESVLISKTVKAREAMAGLFAHKVKVAIIARDYLKDEDSLMKAFHQTPYPHKVFAEDALVFFTKTDFLLDTLNTSIVKKLLTVEGYSLKEKLPQLKSEPELVINDVNSSEYANMLKFAADNKKVVKRFIIKSTSDSVVDYVASHPEAIGIGLMSQVVKDGRFKMLRMGYIDSTGETVQASKPVHQSYIVMGEYPYIVKEYVFLLDDSRTPSYWFSEFIVKERIVVEYLKNYGIAPIFAKYSLIKTDY